MENIENTGNKEKINEYDARTLIERAKELECMYAVDEILQDKDITLAAAMKNLVSTIPIGFTEPEACRVQISIRGNKFFLPDFMQAEILHRTPILSADDEVVGEISVGYISFLLKEECVLLSNEVKLLNAISRHISILDSTTQRELSLLIDMLRQIDPDMLLHILENLRIHLKNISSSSADGVFGRGEAKSDIDTQRTYGEVNTPMAKPAGVDTVALGKKLIASALAYLPYRNVFSLISGWIHEQRILALVKTVDSKYAGVGDILDAVRKYTEAVEGWNPERSHTETWLIAELAHRFLTNDEHIINMLTENLRISDFAPMIEKIIGSETSMGNIGGKGAGLFIASQILNRAAQDDPLLCDIKTPRTWYLAADQIVDFLHYNNLEELNSYKYNSIFHLRMTYDNVVSKIKNAKLPPQTVRTLRVVLEDFGDVPLIVRSSSLLEDRHSGAFSGKYKSLFLANKGSKHERLEALADAILEVYSSMYNPDAVQYCKERGLLNYTEQMGILIQEVIGKKTGRYFMPHFAGVSFSHNFLRWSPRITREGGLVRMVMGLGTRAVDRVSNDYPVLFSPGQPEFQINQTLDDILRYSPRHIDLLNLENGQFETLEITLFLREAGKEISDLHKYVSVCNNDYIEKKNAFTLNPSKDNMVVTFEHILTSSNIPKKLKRMIDVLSEKMGCPIDMEFAFDGEHLYLLQCRPQGSGMTSSPAPIPKNLNAQDIIFTANRFISDGLLSDITHIVYVDGDGYNALSSREELLAVGTAVGLLNDILPHRKYILAGPGRWGSRGDIKLGVRVTYSDISGTAALIEIAKEKHSYVPELSFGTHFFQDLVESGIVYIPLYPDQKDIVFKESFFRYGSNILSEILPQYSWLSDVIRVIDIPSACVGRTLSIHMNSDLEQAVAFLKSSHSESKVSSHKKNFGSFAEVDKTDWDIDGEKEHWQWRYYMAQQVADAMDMQAWGVKGVYLFGSVNTGNTRMGSDIDLLIHSDCNDEQRVLLENWLDGWSMALAKINFLHTGYNSDKLLDFHIVTDEDIKNGDSFAVKINSMTDTATPLRLRQQ